MTELKYSFPADHFDRWDELHALITDAFAFMDARIDPPSSIKRVSAQSLREKSANELLLTCEDGDELVASAFVAVSETSAYIGRLAVKPSHRRKGIARQIFALIEAHARRKNLKKLELQTRVELTENHQTFFALGFEKTAEAAHDGYNRPTFITMTKQLR